MIVGDWEWREGEVAGSARSQSAPRGTGRYGLVYNFESGRKARRSTEKGDRGVSLSTGVTVKDQFVKWGKEVPQTSVVAHTPGASYVHMPAGYSQTVCQGSQYWRMWYV